MYIKIDIADKQLILLDHLTYDYYDNHNYGYTASMSSCNKCNLFMCPKWFGRF